MTKESKEPIYVSPEEEARQDEERTIKLLARAAQMDGWMRTQQLRRLSMVDALPADEKDAYQAIGNSLIAKAHERSMDESQNEAYREEWAKREDDLRLQYDINENE